MPNLFTGYREERAVQFLRKTDRAVAGRFVPHENGADSE